MVVYLLVVALCWLGELVQDCLPTLAHLLPESALLFFQRAHALTEHIALLLRE